MTAKMKMMMHKTNVKLPRAPTVFPIMEMSKLSVGHDFANLNTRNYRDGRDGTDGKEDCQCNCGATDERRLLYDKEITNRNERRTDKPETPSRPSSRSDRKTMMKSKMFQPSLK